MIIDQHGYIEQLQPADIDRSAPIKRTLDKDGKSLLRSISSQICLGDQSGQTRSNIQEMSSSNFEKS